MGPVKGGLVSRNISELQKSSTSKNLTNQENLEGGYNLQTIGYKFETEPKIDSKDIFKTRSGSPGLGLDPNSHKFVELKEIKVGKPVNCFLKKERPETEVNPIKKKLVTIEEASGVFESSQNVLGKANSDEKNFWQLLYREDEQSFFESYEAKRGGLGSLEVVGQRISAIGIEKIISQDKKLRKIE